MAAEPMDLQRPVVRSLPVDRDFDVLYRSHFDRLRRFCLGVTGQESLAEDIAQETLLRAYVRMAQFDFTRPLWPWLKRVAMNLITDHARLAQREIVDADPGVETSWDETAATAERELLDTALRALPTRQRMAVALRYIDDWKPAEVGELLGLTRPAVEQLLHRARRRLCSEYRRLDSDAPARLRVALWPLIILVGRIRDRAARLRQVINDGGTSLALATDATTQAVVALTIAGVLAGGVAAAAEAAPLPDEPANARLTAVTTEATSAVGAATADSSVDAAETSPNAVAPSAAQKQATAPAASTAAAPDTTSTTRVDVAAPPAVAETPAKPQAHATKTRSAERTTVTGAVSRRVGQQGGQTETALTVNCAGGAAMATACDAVTVTDDVIAGES